MRPSKGDHAGQTPLLFYSILAAPLSRSATRLEEVDRRETGATIKVADRPCFAPSPHGYAAVLWRVDPRGAS